MAFAIVVLPLPERPTRMTIGRTPVLSAASDFTAIQSALATRTPEVVPFQVKTTSRVLVSTLARSTISP